MQADRTATNGSAAGAAPNPIKAPPEVYLHLGLGKVASTYLQHRFFPRLQGVQYVPRGRFKHYRQELPRLAERGVRRVLLSREMDRQLAVEARKLAQAVPHARPVLLLRRHDGWIASQYRRYVKNGGTRPFSAFLDLQHDRGLWAQADLQFAPLIEALRAAFAPQPLILLHEDLRAAPWAFLALLAQELGATYDPAQISLRPVHPSYSAGQLRLMRRWGRRLLPDRERPLPAAQPWRWLVRRSQLLRSYALLYPVGYLPQGWLNNAPLVNEAELAAVREAYAADWQACLAWATRPADALHA